MKRSLYLGISALAVVAIAGVLFAQSTIVNKIAQMRAVAGSSTLVGQLEGTPVDARSGPLTGKKTGNAVTAEEYNRILEILKDGGVIPACSKGQMLVMGDTSWLCTPEKASSTWSIACSWDGWVEDVTHGGSFPEGGKGNILSFYCASGTLTSVKWNKGTGTVDTSPASGVNCNYDGDVTIDPRDFDGGGDEIRVECLDGHVIGMGKYLTSPRYSMGSLPSPGKQPTCTASLSYKGVVGYTCTNGKVTKVTK